MSQPGHSFKLNSLSPLIISGRYKAASELLAQHLAHHPTDAEAALAHVRMLLRMGLVGHAAEAMDRVQLGGIAPGIALRLGLEGVWIGLVRTYDLAGAAAEADRLWQESLACAISSAERADALCVRARIIQTAANQKELPQERLGEAKADLIVAVDSLATAGWLDEELNTRLLLAAQAAGDDIAARGYLSVAERARAAGRLDYCADALCREADRRYKLGAALPDIAPLLDAAKADNTAIDRRLGLLDVEAVSAKIRIQQDNAPFSELERILEAFEEHNVPGRQLAALGNLSVAAHRRGDLDAAVRYRKREEALAERVGTRMGRISAQFALADVLMRRSRSLDTIDVCEAALETPLPRSLRGMFEQYLGTSYMLAGDGPRAHRHLGNARAIYEAIGDHASASSVVDLIIADGMRSCDYDALLKSHRLAEEWAVRDTERVDRQAAAVKHKLCAQLLLQIHRVPGFLKDDPALLAEAEVAANRAWEMARGLNGLVGAQRRAEIAQLRGEIALAWQDEEGCETAFRDAAALCDAAGLTLEAANSRKIVGSIRFNKFANAFRAGRFGDVHAHFVEAESNLQDAQDYYSRAGMRGDVADAAHKIALLWSNGSRLVDAESAARMQDTALSELVEAEAMLDEVRADFALGGMLDAKHGKAKIVTESRKLYDLALSIERDRGAEAERLWSWHQKSRARALGDALALHPGVSEALRATIAGQAEKEALLDRETVTTLAIARARGSERAALRQEQGLIRTAMAEHAEFAAYITMRSGRVPELAAICDLLASQRDRKVVIIDWITAGDDLGLMATSAQGVAPIAWVSKGTALLAEVAQRWVNFDRMRRDLLSGQDHLAPLQPLIAPLAQLTARGEHVILCPPGSMQLVPLHAIELEGEPLIARNSISYAPSAAVLNIICARRHDISAPGDFRVFADPTSDRTASLGIAAQIGALLRGEPAVGSMVTRKACLDAMRSAELFHFQGHSRFDGADPLRSKLILAGGETLTAEDILAIAGDIGVKLIVLGACESGRLHMAPGDEPMGLPAALLVAGARAVCAPAWPVDAGDAAAFMACFYRHLMAGGTPQKPALALQTAMNEIRIQSRYTNPYSWAPYVLYGSWD